MFQNEIKISVCVTSFNRKALLQRCLSSIIAQSYRNFEIIVVDNGSNDGSAEFISEFFLQHSLVESQIFLLGENRGLVYARNLAIEKARGGYFSFCDDDDYWSPEFLSNFSEIIQNSDPNSIFCCLSQNGDCGSIPFKQICLKSAVKLGFTPPVAGQMYPLTLVKKIGGYSAMIASGIDHDLWIKLSVLNVTLVPLKKRLVFINQSFQDNRITTNSEQRKIAIENSLKVWKPIITANYPEGFFEFFEQNYKFYLLKNALLKAFADNKFKEAILIFLSMNKTFIYKQLKRTFVFSAQRKVIGKPSFFPLG